MFLLKMFGPIIILYMSHKTPTLILWR